MKFLFALGVLMLVLFFFQDRLAPVWKTLWQWAVAFFRKIKAYLARSPDGDDGGSSD